MPFESVHIALGPRLGSMEIVAMRYHGSWEFDGEVVGESFYQDALVKRFALGKEGAFEEFCEAVLMPEDDNPRDPNAVCVMIDWHIVGYLPAQEAEEYRTAISELGFGSMIAVVDARVARSKNAGSNIGVTFDMVVYDMSDE